MKTYTLTPKEINKKWFIIDADGLVLGRLASQIALRLRGKHKAAYTPHMDCGDNIVVINAEKIHVTGKKLENERFYWHTGYAGGIKNRTLGQILEGKFPERLIQNAVRRMLPKGPLGRQVLGNLRVYKGLEHPHTAQMPEAIDIASQNVKNTKRS
ncbi:MAG: 50S ribosomal protein L13 [Alphaproteobacteria bacterium]|jgi:large subunit ribosomal protein L13|nr:50S ribosomal protein L13 [Alphaproteobacteria bacterium]MDP1976003.1 50S ribosomal protein L13 [Alphaproteobacteria bacterium]